MRWHQSIHPPPFGDVHDARQRAAFSGDKARKEVVAFVAVVTPRDDDDAIILRVFDSSAAADDFLLPSLSLFSLLSLLACGCSMTTMIKMIKMKFKNK